MPKSIAARKSLKGGPNKPFPGKLGSGKLFYINLVVPSHGSPGSRFDKCKERVGKHGARSPAAVCAAIGQSKYGKTKFQHLAAKGRR